MLDAVLWDYDGTLADSYEKNYSVTLDVLKKGVPRLHKELPAALESVDTFFKAVTAYEDWRRLYTECYGMTSEETELAGRLWEPCQRESTLIAPLYDGVGELLKRYKDRKQGIVSQNSGEEILKAFSLNGLDGCAGYVCGYTDVPQFSPKPSPVPFLKCAEMLGIKPFEDTIVYIGDHEEDVLFVRNIRRYYAEKYNAKIRIFSVAVSYSGSNPRAWKNQPDYQAHSIAELGEVLRRIDNDEIIK